ncbi:hypothetical protein [Erwinia sp. S38]|uniref:hypothetical protein n=1 Tax=Erwinia sp. S38 TaxID=2769338 RepID=UPI00190D611D|nr:hypothetical protein [Erwinia sp. S38]MBK0004396.1 hypothetical protein [Erwinia sp. S38]
MIDGLAWLYSFFDIKLLTIIATIFTIYFGYQKVTRKICVSYSLSQGKLYKSHVTNFVISNKRDNSIIIKSIDMTIGTKGTVSLMKLDEPLVLKGYEAKLLDIPKYSFIHGDNGDVFIDIFERLSFNVITMSGDVIVCETESPITKDNADGRLTKVVSTFDDIVLTDKMGFIFKYRINNTVKSTIFDKFGFIPENTPFGYNKFNDMSSDSFGSFLISNGYHDYYDDYSLYEVTDNLEVPLVFNKHMMKNKINNENT